MNLVQINENINRLLANLWAILGFFKEYLVDPAKYVSMTFINADGSETTNTFPNIAMQIANKNDKLDMPIQVTVGTGGDYLTINEAIQFLDNKYNGALFSKVSIPYTATILLLSGFIMKEQVFIQNGNYGWITITSEDTEVTVDRSKIIEPRNDLLDYYPVMYGDSCTFLTLRVIFNVDATDFDAENITSKICGFVFSKTIVDCKYSGVKNAPYIGIRAMGGSNISSGYSNFSSSGVYGVLGTRSSIWVSNSNLDNCGNVGLRLLDACTAHASSSSMQSCGLGLDPANGNSPWEGAGIEVSDASSLDASFVNTSSSHDGIRSNFSGVVNAPSAIANNCVRNGIASFAQGEITFRDAQALNAGEIGAKAGGNSTINITNSSLTGAGINGVHSAGGHVYGASTDARKAVGVDDIDDIFVTSGGIIKLPSGLGGTNITPNTLTANGIIFK